MKRSHTFDDLSSSKEDIEQEEAPRKKTFLEQVSNKIPRFKIPKKTNKSRVESDKSSPVTEQCPVSRDQNSDQTSSSLPSQQSPKFVKTIDQLQSDVTHKQSTPDPGKPENNAELARQHYNTLKQVSLDKRHESKIFNLRGFNNYVKSLTMNDFLARLGPLGQKGATILDLGCGKGGDLRKWGLAKPAHLVCVDIADVSIQQCRDRYKERPQELTYKANFIVADCTRDNLDDKFKEENIQDVEFDLVSCQFALHYGFESQDQAKRMIKNAVSRLKPNSFFFGTIPHSNYLVKKYLSLSEGSRFGNDVFYVDFLESNRTSFPLFGAKYVFYLDGAVKELPEYLIHFPLLKAMLEEEGCECVLAQPFPEYIYQTDPQTGERVLKEVVVLSRTRGLNDQGTLLHAEWDVVACYMAFGFRKLTDEEREERRDSKRRKVS